MTHRLHIVAAAIASLAIAACSTPSTERPGLAASQSIVNGVFTPTAPSKITVSTRRCDAVNCEFDKVTFTDGPLAGRTLEFGANNVPTSGLLPGETAFLGAVASNRANGYVLGINTATAASSYAVYSIPNTVMPGTGNASYVGKAVGYGFSPTGSGLADGTFSSFVSFTGKKMVGQMNSITFRSGGSFPTIQFTADIDSATGKFLADSITGTGIPLVGHLEGGIEYYTLNGVVSNETAGAFAVNSGVGPTSTSYGLTGAFTAAAQ